MEISPKSPDLVGERGYGRHRKFPRVSNIEEQLIHACGHDPPIICVEYRFGPVSSSEPSIEQLAANSQS